VVHVLARLMVEAAINRLSSEIVLSMHAMRAMSERQCLDTHGDFFAPERGSKRAPFCVWREEFTVANAQVGYKAQPNNANSGPAGLLEQ
jgi:hypothetical protein